MSAGEADAGTGARAAGRLTAEKAAAWRRALTREEQLRAIAIHIAVNGPRRYIHSAPGGDTVPERRLPDDDERGEYCIVASRTVNGQKVPKTVWVTKATFASEALKLSGEGYTVWSSLNDKVMDSRAGVRGVTDIWFDFDTPHEGERAAPATDEEMADLWDFVVLFVAHIRDSYGANPAIALSGNGFHIHYPVPYYPVSETETEALNTRLQAFVKGVYGKLGLSMDELGDLRRVTTVIGTPNLKIPGRPLTTRWVFPREVAESPADEAIQYVHMLRLNNEHLVERMMSFEAEEKKEKKPVYDASAPGLPITKVIDVAAPGWRSHGHGHFKGPSPWHNSKTGNDTDVDTGKNAWYCFNHQSGGGPFEAIAVKEGVIACNEARKGCLKGKFKEVLKIAKETYGYEPPAGRQAGADESSSATLNDLIGFVSSRCQIYCDQYDTPFAFLNGRAVPLRSKRFAAFVTHGFVEETRRSVGAATLDTLIRYLSGSAFERQPVTLEPRVVNRDGEIWVDLANDKGEAIRITKDGWSVAKVEAPMFIRYKQTLPMDVDESGTADDLKAFVRYWNLSDPDDEVLVAGAMGSAFFDASHVILFFLGPQSATKSTASKAVRNVIDPAPVKTASLTRDENEFNQKMAHNYVPVFDNVTELTDHQIDMLCRAATGEGNSKRELYTDQEDVLMQYRRFVIMNGINLPSYRGDLMERLLPIALKRPTARERKEDSEVSTWLASMTPKARAAIFSALARAMKKLDEVRAELKGKRGGLPRMADFAVVGEAFCRALGYEDFKFYDRYMSNIETSSASAIENDDIARLVVAYIDGEETKAKLLEPKPGSNSKLVITPGEGYAWSGSPRDLYDGVKAANEEIKTLSKKEEDGLTLQRFVSLFGNIEANLTDNGYKVVRSRTASKRVITIIKSVPERGDKPDRQSRGDGQGDGQSRGDGQTDERTQLETVLAVFKMMCGPENGEVEEQSVLNELAKLGLEPHQATKLVMSLIRNGQVYERSPGRFSLTIS